MGRRSKLRRPWSRTHWLQPCFGRQQRIGDRLDSTPALLLHSIASVGIWDIHGPHAMPTVFPALGSGIWIRRREDRNDSDLQQLVPSLYGLFLRPTF